MDLHHSITVVILLITVQRSRAHALLQSKLAKVLRADNSDKVHVLRVRQRPDVASSRRRSDPCFGGGGKKYELLMRASPTYCARRPVPRTPPWTRARSQGGFHRTSWSSARNGAAKITKYLIHCGLLVVRNTTVTPQPKIPTMAHPMDDQQSKFLLLVAECNGHGRCNNFALSCLESVNCCSECPRKRSLCVPA